MSIVKILVQTDLKKQSGPKNQLKLLPLIQRDIFEVYSFAFIQKFFISINGTTAKHKAGIGYLIISVNHQSLHFRHECKKNEFLFIKMTKVELGNSWLNKRTF